MSYTDDDYRDDVQDDLDDFDLDFDYDDDDDTDAGDTGDDRIPKSRVSKIIKNRLARERAKQEELNKQFVETYGMPMDQILDYGKKARKAATTQPYQQQPPQQPQQPVDPVHAELAEIKARQFAHEAQRQREAEAQQFVTLYPDIKFEDIPQEVLQRRAAGGVTLAEAYRLHVADKQVQDAMKQGAKGAMRNLERKGRTRIEGQDVSGGGGGTDEDSIDALDRELAAQYGMSPKEFITYQRKVQKLREGV